MKNKYTLANQLASVYIIISQIIVLSHRSFVGKILKNSRYWVLLIFASNKYFKNDREEP